MKWQHVWVECGMQETNIPVFFPGREWGWMRGDIYRGRDRGSLAGPRDRQERMKWSLYDFVHKMAQDSRLHFPGVW